MLSRISIDYVSLLGLCFYTLNCVCSLSHEAKPLYNSLYSFQLYHWQVIVYYPACTPPLFLSSMAAPEVNPQIKAQDKNVQWYQADLETVSPQARELLENYSHIPPNEVIPHILKTVSSPPSFLPSPNSTPAPQINTFFTPSATAPGPYSPTPASGDSASSTSPSLSPPSTPPSSTA